MARLWSSGFELGSNTSGVEWINCAGAAATVQSAVARSGTYAGKVTAPGSGTRSGWLMQYKTGTSAALKFRFYLRVDVLPNVETTIAVFGTGTATLAGQSLDWRLTLGTTGLLKFYDVNRAGAQITGTTPLTADGARWYRVELAMVDPDPISGVIGWDLYLDGTLEGSHYPNGISSDPIHFSLGINLNADTATAGTLYFDDAAVNDGTGSAQAGLPGAGSIIHLMPGSAGDFAEGALSGGTPSATAWQSMDEVPPNDATDSWTLQVDSASSTSADRVDVGLLFPAAFSMQSVTLVQVGARISTLTAASASWVPRIKSQASGTILEGTTVTIAVTAWNTNDDTATTRAYKLTSYTDPQAAGAWTQALLATTQIGARAPDATPDVLISTLWALVEYVPAPVCIRTRRGNRVSASLAGVRPRLKRSN